MNILTKTPKGTFDIYNNNYNKLNFYKLQLETMFKNYGGIGLETPIYELRENLMNKYGEEAESKLVFNIENSGSDEAEKYTLRYDLTVPKLRFIKSNSIDKARIYSIGKVYRRDNPSLGRYREFYQADFDIVGENSSTLINELLLLKMADEFIKVNNLGSYKILINDTENLKYLLVNIVKIDPLKFKNICSIIDKLDKFTFDEIIIELKNKGLNDEQINILKSNLQNNKPSYNDTTIKINKLIDMANNYCFGSNIIFTPHMARGLDYYNGIIFEIVLDNFKSTIISGGRYDNTIDENTSLIGISFGLSRMFNLLNYNNTNQWKNLYYLTSISNNINIDTKINIASKLEKQLNINIILNSDEKEKKLVKTISWCAQNYIKYLFVIAPDELKNNQIIFKDLENSTQKLIDLI